MSPRVTLLLSGVIALLVAGCGSLRYMLPGHSSRQHNATVTMRPGETVVALETPRRLPAPGGFELGLVSEDPVVVAVERVESFGGAAVYRLIAHAAGTTRVHYVNRYSVRSDAVSPAALAELRSVSLESFSVTVEPVP